MKIPHGTLVLVADGEKRLLLRNEGDEKFPVLQTLSQETQPHAATRELGDDRPGRSFASGDPRRSAYSDTDWHQDSEDLFAIRSAEALERAAAEHGSPVIVLAAPRALGVLRKHWGARTQELLIGEIAKDVTHRTTDVIVETILAAD